MDRDLRKRRLLLNGSGERDSPNPTSGSPPRVSSTTMAARTSPSGLECSIPTIADTDSNRLRTGIPIDRGQHSDDCGHELPSTALWVHMTPVRVKLATVDSDFLEQIGGPCASRSDRHESNAATRAEGSCWPTGAGVVHGLLLIFLLPSLAWWRVLR